MPSRYDDVRKAIYLASRGKTEEAISILEDALKNSGESDDFSRISLIGRNLATLYCQKGDLASAEICLRRVLAIAPSEGRSGYQLGDVLIDMGRVLEARVVFEKAFESAVQRHDWDLVNLLRSRGIDPEAA